MLSNLKQSDREEVEQALFLLPQIMEPLRGQPQLPAQIVRLLMAEGISARNAIFAVRCAFEQGSLVIGDGQNALVLALNRGVG